MKRDNSVLIVEDNPILGSMMADMVEVLGRTAIIAENEASAIAQVRSEKFGLLICDLKLGDGGNGLAVVVEALECQPRLQIILVSGNNEPPDLPGGVKYLAKPFTLAQLRSIVGDV